MKLNQELTEVAAEADAAVMAAAVVAVAEAATEVVAEPIATMIATNANRVGNKTCRAAFSGRPFNSKLTKKKGRPIAASLFDCIRPKDKRVPTVECTNPSKLWLTLFLSVLVS